MGCSGGGGTRVGSSVTGASLVIWGFGWSDECPCGVEALGVLDDGVGSEFIDQELRHCRDGRAVAVGVEEDEGEWDRIEFVCLQLFC